MSLYYLFMKWIIQNTTHFNWAGWSPREGSKPTDYFEFVEWNEKRASLHCLSYNDNRADHVGSSVVGSSGPTASYPPLPCEEVRAPVFSLRRSAVKSLAAPLRYKAAFDVCRHVWSSSGWCSCWLHGGHVLVPNQPFLSLPRGLFSGLLLIL